MLLASAASGGRQFIWNPMILCVRVLYLTSPRYKSSLTFRQGTGQLCMSSLPLKLALGSAVGLFRPASLSCRRRSLGFLHRHNTPHTRYLERSPQNWTARTFPLRRLPVESSKRRHIALSMKQHSPSVISASTLSQPTSGLPAKTMVWKALVARMASWGTKS